MLEIKTQAELDALEDESWNVLIDDTCQATGDLYVRGNLEVRNNLYVHGDLSVGGNLFVGNYLSVGDNLFVGGELEVGGDLDVRYNLSVRYNLYVRGNWFWSHASMPSVGGKLTHKRILPPQWQREHWATRLDQPWINDEALCYSSIVKRLQPLLPELLAQDKWSDTERWILQSLVADREDGE